MFLLLVVDLFVDELGLILVGVEICDWELHELDYYVL